MIVLGVYKRSDDSNEPLGAELWGNDGRGKSKQASKSNQGKNSSGSKSQNAHQKGSEPSSGVRFGPGHGKPFVWLHPPKCIELQPNDELFVLSDPNLMDTLKDVERDGRQLIDSSKLVKTEEKKTQEANINSLKDLNKGLLDLTRASKEW